MNASERSKKNNDNGFIGELAVMRYFIQEGYAIFEQRTGKELFDLAIYKNGEFTRVSVKSTTRKRGNGYCVDLRSNRAKGKRKFNPDSCDVVAIYIIPENKVVLWDSVCIETNSITVTI